MNFTLPPTRRRGRRAHAPRLHRADAGTPVFGRRGGGLERQNFRGRRGHALAVVAPRRRRRRVREDLLARRMVLKLKFIQRQWF